jgi:hypothetical protein
LVSVPSRRPLLGSSSSASVKISWLLPSARWKAICSPSGAKAGNWSEAGSSVPCQLLPASHGARLAAGTALPMVMSARVT